MRTKFIYMTKAAGFVSIALASLSANADPMAYKTDSGIEFIPTLGVFYEGDDNINKADRGENIESVNIWGVEPALLAKIERNQYRANILYKLSAGFSSDEQNDYDDHTFQFTNFFEFNHRNRLVVDYQFRAQHEEKGEDFTEGQGSLLNEPC